MWKSIQMTLHKLKSVKPQTAKIQGFKTPMSIHNLHQLVLFSRSDGNIGKDWM